MNSWKFPMKDSIIMSAADVLRGELNITKLKTSKSTAGGHGLPLNTLHYPTNYPCNNVPKEDVIWQVREKVVHSESLSTVFALDPKHVIKTLKNCGP